MTIDSNLLKQALQLQKNLGREPWMDDLPTIKAMRTKKVDWKIIHQLISQKHNLDISKEVFERQVNRLLKAASSSKAGTKNTEVLRSGSASERTTEVTPEGTIQVTLEGTDQGTFSDLDKHNPVN